MIKKCCLTTIQITRSNRRRPSPALGAAPLIAIVDTILARLITPILTMYPNCKYMYPNCKNAGTNYKKREDKMHQRYQQSRK
jgi:hypothetical protein